MRNLGLTLNSWAYAHCSHTASFSSVDHFFLDVAFGLRLGALGGQRLGSGSLYPW